MNSPFGIKNLNKQNRIASQYHVSLKTHLKTKKKGKNEVN